MRRKLAISTPSILSEGPVLFHTGIHPGPDRHTGAGLGELVSVRCIRIHTNIDLTKVRFNSVQYNIRDLESKIYVPERNQLIVDTWIQYVKDMRTVIFCASIKHAQEIAGRLRDAGVAAESVSGEIKASDRR